MPAIPRPLPGEYAVYFETYLGKLAADQTDLLALLREQPAQLAAQLAGVTNEAALRPTGPGKWSLKQILIHLIDTERVFAYRTLAVARGEQTPLPSFEQDDYVAAAAVATRSVADLLAEHATQRAATVALLHGLTEAAYTRTGTVSGHRPTSVRALAWIIAAHEAHHHRLLPQQIVAAQA